MKSSTVKANWGWWLLSVLFALIFIAILIGAYTGNLPPALTQNDKAAHLILYAIATFLGHRAFDRRRMKLLGFVLPLFPTLFTLFTIVEEGLQSLSPNRSLDALDLVMSLLGVAIGYWLAERKKEGNG
ncbi:MAG: VanZ family protein [Oscillatoriales cyanobacterium C42_A2020_001]|nr:VanZ family protein [Leptolyngbyaceae cyanobacterium C42_A2020_001]